MQLWYHTTIGTNNRIFESVFDTEYSCFRVSTLGLVVKHCLTLRESCWFAKNLPKTPPHPGLLKTENNL